MIRSIVLLALFLHSTSGHIVSKPSSHYSDALKIKCDAVPFRSVYLDRNCYFVIDANTDVSTSTKRCSSALSDSKVVQPGFVPADVWSTLFVDKNSFISDSHSAGKTKAMCIFENQFPSTTGVLTSNAHGTSIRKGANITARMMMPVLLKFPNPLEVGQTITIKGFFSPHEQRPSFNLQHGEFLDSIAIHYVIDFNANLAQIDTSRSRNHWDGERDGSWSNNLQTMLFYRGGPFDIRFRVHEDHFQIFANGKDIYNHKFRIPLTTVTHLSVVGLGVVTYVSLGEKHNPVPYSSAMRRKAAIENPFSRMLMPSLFKFPEPLEIGQTIIVKGMFDPREMHPSFNLQHNDMDSVAIHYIVGFDNNFALIDTSRSRGQWDGSWDRSVYNDRKEIPFKVGGPFDIRFQVQEDHFLLFANGKEINNRKFRIPLSTVNTLGVYGMGIITFVQLGEKYKPVLNSSITDSATLRDKDQQSLSPAEEIFANGFPVCGKDSCSTPRVMYASNVSIANCKSLFISGRFRDQYATPSVGAISNIPILGYSYIDLKRKNGDIAIRISPQFDKKIVLLNSFKEGKWLEEEMVIKFPFKKEKKFEISITNEVYGFQIFVDGVYLASFKHRMCSFDIAEVEVSPHVAELGIQL